MEYMMTYVLTDICDFGMIDDQVFLNTQGLKSRKKGDLHVVKYDKQQINQDNIHSLGLFRSVIVKDGKVVSFSPPKSMHYEDFKSKYAICDCNFEEFVEGTMMHCFFADRWEIATKSVIGAGFKFAAGRNKTFKDMFMEAMGECRLSFEHLDKNYSYIFILQHPENRIVTPFETPSLVLLKIYKNEEVVHEKNIYSKEFDDLRMLVKTPNKFDYTLWEDVENCHKDLDWVHPGIMMYAPDGTRSKIRNSKYENIKHLKGNNLKTQFQYLNLRRMRKISEFLKYYPEMKESFSKYRNDVHNWTSDLYKYYVDFKIKHAIKNMEIPYEYRPHVFNIHNMYIREGKKITFPKVIQYVNDLASIAVF